MTFWKQVVFTDESKIKISGSEEYLYGESLLKNGCLLVHLIGTVKT